MLLVCNSLQIDYFIPYFTTSIYILPPPQIFHSLYRYFSNSVDISLIVYIFYSERKYLTKYLFVLVPPYIFNSFCRYFTPYVYIYSFCGYFTHFEDIILCRGTLISPTRCLTFISEGINYIIHINCFAVISWCSKKLLSN